MNYPSPQPKDQLFSPETVQREEDPWWSQRDPPRLGLARRGVLYGGLSDATVRTILGQMADPGQKISWTCQAWGGVGPSLFYGRDGDGRWIPYDLDANDENLECLVRDRDWPWCWGDVLWACGVWELQLTFFRWELNHGGSLFVGRPFSDPQDEGDLANFTRQIAVAESTRWAPGRLGPGFWSGLPPEPGPSRSSPPA